MSEPIFITLDNDISNEATIKTWFAHWREAECANDKYPGGSTMTAMRCVTISGIEKMALTGLRLKKKHKNKAAAMAVEMLRSIADQIEKSGTSE